MKLFALLLLAVERQIASAAEITGADEKPNKQIRNVLVRGGGDKAGRKDKSGVLDDLPDEEASTIHRLLWPAPYDDSLGGQCTIPSLTSYDQYGCPPGKMAVCYYHASSKSNSGGHYHTKCWDYVNDVDPSVPSISSDKFFAYCGPCQCSETIVATSLTIKIGKSANNVACPTCQACGGADSVFIYNAKTMSYEKHATLAASLGCTLADMDTETEFNKATASIQSGEVAWVSPDSDYYACAFEYCDYPTSGYAPTLRSDDLVQCHNVSNTYGGLYECCPRTVVPSSFDYCVANSSTPVF